MTQQTLSSLDINSNREGDGEVIPNYTLTVTSNKYDLYKKIIIGLGAGCLFMLFLVIVFGALYGDADVKTQTKRKVIADLSEPLDDLCLNNSMCFSAAAFHEMVMNKSADPCENFYEYACGNWKYLDSAKLSPYDRQKTVYSVMASENERKILKILNNKYYNPSRQYEYKLKVYYLSCMDIHERETQLGKPLLKYLTGSGTLGPWYVLNKTMDGWDFDNAMYHAHVTFYSPVLFDYGVVRDYTKDEIANNMSQSALVLYHGGLGSRYMRYQMYLDPDRWGYKARAREAYKNLIEEVGVLLARDAGLSNGTEGVWERVQTFKDDVFEMETMLAKLYNSSALAEDAYDDEERMTIHDLKDHSPEVDWIRLLRGAFGSVITDYYKIIVHEKAFLYKLTANLKQMETSEHYMRKMNNYIVWRVTYGWLQDLSEDYRHAWRVFMSRFNYRTTSDNQQDDCYKRATYAMGDALGALFVRDHFGDNAKPYIDEIMVYLKQSLRDHIKSGFKWMDDETKKVALKKVNSIIDMVGHPAGLDPTNPNVLNAVYSKFVVSFRNTYFQNELQRVVWLNSRATEQLRNGIDQNEWPITVPSVYVKYSRGWNDILVPAGVLQLPLFRVNLPHFMNFATMGSMIMREMIHSIDQIGAYYSPEGQIQRWWSDATYKEFSKARKCAFDLYGNQTAGPFKIGSKHYSVAVNSYNGASIGLPEIAGITYSHRAYKRYTESVGEEKRIPGLADTLDKQFYIVYGMTHCYSRGGYWDWRKARMGGLNEDINLNVALSQTKHFINTFGCSKDSRLGKLYEDYKCRVFN